MNEGMNRLFVLITLLLSLSAVAADFPKSKLAYWLIGPDNAEPVVLIHGFNSAHDTWKPILSALSEKYRVLTYDQPGHGKSPDDGIDNTPQKQAERLLVLLDQLNWKHVRIVGHSMGGRTAIAFAAAYPDRVKSVLVEDMSLMQDPASVKKLPHALALYPKVKAAIPGSFANQDAAWKALSVFYTPEEIAYIGGAAEWKKDGTLVLGNRPEVTMLYLNQGLALDMTPELKAVKAKLGFFAADPATHMAVLFGPGLEHVRTTRPDALVQIFPGINHLIHARKEFLAPLLEFLK